MEASARLSLQDSKVQLENDIREANIALKTLQDNMAKLQQDLAAAKEQHKQVAAQWKDAAKELTAEQKGVLLKRVAGETKIALRGNRRCWGRLTASSPSPAQSHAVMLCTAVRSACSHKVLIRVLLSMQASLTKV